ncbi:SulP family inorganic anion transporter, partial [Guyparkeria sp. 1SP6A2]|nr:SulP family inorganic anion transporter [Guyparkeria sp. 1SP6A2]
ALGFANLASAFSQGFAISGADSRTAVNDANGGKSQLVSIIAAVVIGFVAIFLNPQTPLRASNDIEAMIKTTPNAALGIYCSGW